MPAESFTRSPWEENLAFYRRWGWRVFPCHAAFNGQCSCGKSDCDSAGKHPRTANGVKDATCDIRQINQWWPPRATRPSNIGVAMGRASGVLAIDVDPRHGGHETLAELEALFGPLSKDWSVATGGGGLHVYLAYPQGGEIKSRNGWRPGVDVKAAGGYVVGPPSTHVSGAAYAWRSRMGDAPPPLPAQWLVALTEAAPQATATEPSVSGDHSQLLQRAQQYAARIPAALEGGRNDAAFKLAGHIASFATDAGTRLSETDTLNVLESWNQRCDPPLAVDELKKCLASALTNGTPRSAKVVKPTGDERALAPAASKLAKTQATSLVELADDADLFHDPDGEAYARFPVGSEEHFHWEVSRVRSKSFRRWLAQRFYRSHGKVPSAQAQQDALGVVEAKAIFDGETRRVGIRVAEQGSRIYVDLANDLWQAIEIDAAGWRIIDQSPVMFRRSKAMLGLPTPAQESRVDELRRFANVTDDDWPLVLGWLVAALRAAGPYPVLAVYGEHGSGKSGLCRRLRSLVDPNSAPLRADYREPRDLMICATSGWVVALDNLSLLTPWLSDCLCRLSTGGGFSTRTLYQDDEETIFDAQRPVALNCIEEVVTRSDLLDRCVLLNLPRIEQHRRLSEKQLHHEFEAARPRILGGLLNAVVAALQNEKHVHLPQLPRMADFAIWVTAAERGLDLAPGQFLRAYNANRAAGNDTAIEASPVGKALVEFVNEACRWSGTSTTLLAELDSRNEQASSKLKSWPGTPRTLSGIVKRLAPNLREAGIDVEFTRSGRSRLITLARTDRDSSVTSVICVTDAVIPASAGDEKVTQRSHLDAGDPSIVTALPRMNSEVETSGDARDANDAEIPSYSLEPEWAEA